MKSTSKNTIKLLLFFSILSLFNSCCSRNIKKVKPDTKIEFGMAFTAPTQAILFVENEKVSRSIDKTEAHTTMANTIYNNYGPSTDKRYLGKTNARQLKFTQEDKTYFIDITALKHRTAMILFDGKKKPIIEYNPKKYQKRFFKEIYPHKIQ